MRDYTNALPIGFITKTRGVKGELVIELNDVNLFNNIKESLFVEIDGLMVPFFIESKKNLQTNKISVKLQHIDNQTKAIEFIDYNVFIPQQDIDTSENDISPSLLIGFNVTDKNYGDIGIIEDFIDNKNNPLIAINHNNNEILLPFNQDFILSIDTENKILNIESPEGLINLYINE